MERKSFLRPVLAANGIVDFGCAAILLVLPLLRIPVLGYQVFDSQAALPLAVGVVFGALYTVSAILKR